MFLFRACNKIVLDFCFTHVFLFLFLLLHDLDLGLNIFLFPSWFKKPLVIFVSVTTYISSTHLQAPPKTFCPTCGHQFTSRRFIHHQCSWAFNSSNPNPYGHPGLISSLVPTLPTLAWTWISSLDVLGSFHLNFHHLQLYNHIPIALQCNVQVAFFFPLDKLKLRLIWYGNLAFASLVTPMVFWFAPLLRGNRAKGNVDLTQTFFS